MKYHRGVLSGIALLLGLSSAAFVNEARAANGYSELEVQLCMQDRARVADVFTERFPNEKCAPLSQCDRRLVVSAEVISIRRCRQGAIASCLSLGQGSDCLTELQTRWAGSADKTEDRLNWSIGLLDLDNLPPLVARRVGKFLAGYTPAKCDNARVVDEVLGPDVPERNSCGLFQALSRLEAAETIARILSRPHP